VATGHVSLHLEIIHLPKGCVCFFMAFSK